MKAPNIEFLKSTIKQARKMGKDYYVAVAGDQPEWGHWRDIMSRDTAACLLLAAGVHIQSDRTLKAIYLDDEDRVWGVLGKMKELRVEYLGGGHHD